MSHVDDSLKVFFDANPEIVIVKMGVNNLTYYAKNAEIYTDVVNKEDELTDLQNLLCGVQTAGARLRYFSRRA